MFRDERLAATSQFRDTLAGVHPPLLGLHSR